MVSLELLCPAKDYATGVTAVDHGADAIYIGATKFGAREDAGNSLEDIEKLVQYAHQFFVKVYVTVNTIIFEEELAQVKALIEELYKLGVDAIIIQDMAILEMDLPPIQIFASTQTNNTTVEKVAFLEKVGFKRVILARELSLQEIREIRSKTTIDLEFFIHGALCVCYSGQCYLSQEITGRSANRGACAQPCRSSYDLLDEDGRVLVKKKHLLSLKDLNLSNYLNDLIKAGITSFKIEGRLKDTSYVKNITSFYSQLLNSIIKSNPNIKRSSSGRCDIGFEPDPDRSFNRGFTKHFISGRQRSQSSMDTQKSIGKKLGIVSKVDKGWFSIQGNPELANGDGLCFINSKGILTGLKVNKIENDKIIPYNQNGGIKVGVEIFRNFDQKFTKQLNNSNHNRWIDITVLVHEKESIIEFVVSDEDNIATYLEVENSFDLAKDPQKALETIKSQLSKAGDTIFRVSKIEISIDKPIFIPISHLNKIRRELLDKHLQNRLKNYKRELAMQKSNSCKYPEISLNFKANISNSLSKKFYSKHGVNSIDNAFEIEKANSSRELMVTRYCIKFEMGICPSKQNGKKTGNLFLRDNQNLYPIEFDCKNCLMKVKSPIKK